MQAFAPNTKDFWLQEQVSEQQFLKSADTFDLLLFKTNTNAAKIQRFYTNSEFGKSKIDFNYRIIFQYLRLFIQTTWHLFSDMRKALKKSMTTTA